MYARCIILLRDGVRLLTSFGLVIGFIGLFDRARDYTLQFSVTHTHTHTHTSVHSHVSTSRRSVAASNSGLFPSSGLPNCPRPQLPASNSNSSQLLNLSSSFANSLTNQLTQLNSTLTNCPTYKL
jgi:hypothetical protein